MTDSKLVKVCTRGSLLARTQTQWVIDRLKEKNPDVSFETVIIKTSGDIFSRSNEMGAAPMGKGMFTKEIEEALLEGRADIAVHSLKDLPTVLPDGLVLGAAPERADPRDAVIGPADILQRLRAEPSAVSVGTSSIRRKAQMRAAYPGCRTVDIRGNVDTRLRKIEEGKADCIILAVSGLDRLGRSGDITAILDASVMLPAPAQGALGIEIRQNDHATAAIVSGINCANTFARVSAERSFLHGLGSGCRAPVGALAEISGATVILRGRVISEDGSVVFEGKAEGLKADASSVGTRLAEQLLSEGAGRILEQCRSMQ